MSLNNKIFLLIIFFSSVIFFSCSDNKSNNQPAEISLDYNNPAVVMQQAKNILGNNVKFAYKGTFDNDSTIEIAAGTEENGPKLFGIKFYLLKEIQGKLSISYESPLLNGSYKECLIKKIKFPLLNYELVYYNSQSFYLGSGGGEIFSYIINYKDGKVYYAHFISNPNNPIALYVSKDIDMENIKNFFIANFKRDYPNLKLIDKDIILKY